MISSKDSKETIAKIENHNNEYRYNSIKNITKFQGNELFYSKDKLAFSEKMIFGHTFYILTENKCDSVIFDEIRNLLSHNIFKFGTFSFNFFQNNEYITIFLEFSCFLIEIHENLQNSILQIILSQLSKSPINFISPNISDYQRLNDLVNKINEESIKNESKTINLKNFVFSHEKQEEINYEVRQIVQKIERKIMKNEIFYLIKDSMLAFLIRRFYFKRKFFKNPDFFDFQINSFKLKEFQKGDFIEIRSITLGNFLVLYKNTNQLFVQKIFKNLLTIDDFQSKIEMYEKLNKTGKFAHCFGYIKNELNQVDSLIFEFMSGGNLEEFISRSNSKKGIDYKYKISFEIIEGIFTLHSNDIIHRDLKPDNIFINNESRFVIGDFDCSRIIDNNDETMVMTTDVGQIKYSSPEMRFSQKYFKSTDIYSYGLILYFIFAEEHPFSELNDYDILQMNDETQLRNMIKKGIDDEFIQNISAKCIRFSQEERPTSEEILELFIDFFIKCFINNRYKSLLYLLKRNDYAINEKIISIYNNKYLIKDRIKLDHFNIYIIITRLLSLKNGNKNINYLIHSLEKLSENNNSKAQFLLGKIYYKNDFVNRDINKAIHYYSLSANQNEDRALYKLGTIYYTDIYVPRNINKAIQYFTLSANQNNNPLSEYFLGSIYLEGKFVKQDITKSIHYFTLSADQNNQYSEYFLGVIYFNGTYVTRNINKAIYYFTLSANQNNELSQYSLGLIYYEGKHVPRDIKKALFYFTLSANQNKKESQFYLGLIYYEGSHVSVDIKKAIHYFTLSADQNHLYSQYLLGLFYFDGKYVSFDLNKAVHYLTLSADQNFVESQYNLGLLYQRQELFDISKSVHYLTLAANSNNSEAQYQLGLLYYNGTFIEPDIKKSIHYFTLASNQNNPMAQLFLGCAYLKGDMIMPDFDKAVYYFTLSANLKNPTAQFFLGGIYLRGKVVTQDITKSIYYFDLAAKQNNIDAQKFLGDFYYNGKIIPRDINKAIYYYTLSANQNDLNSQIKLATIYSDGYYTPIDIKKSIHYFNLAAKQNDSFAQFFLGKIYLEGKYIQRNINKAFHYLNLSLNQNNSYAQLILGCIYYGGMHVTRDVNKAIYYFNLSIKQNNSYAQYILGMFYYEGVYVTKDIDKSIYYLTKSANQNNRHSQFLLGYVYFKSKEYNKAIKYLTLCSAQYDRHACFILGVIYFTNKYTKRDLNKSIHYFKEASSLNDESSKNNLGIIYQNGYEVAQNIPMSKEYFEEAIRINNDIYSLYNLSRIYYFGKCNNIVNIDKAIKLLEKASEQNFLPSDFFLFMIYSYGNTFHENKEKSNDHVKNIMESKFSNVMTIFYLYPKQTDRIFIFIKDFDFFYALNTDYEEIFFNHLCNVIIDERYIVPDCLQELNENISENKRNFLKEINELFYEGFGIE